MQRDTAYRHGPAAAPAITAAEIARARARLPHAFRRPPLQRLARLCFWLAFAFPFFVWLIVVCSKSISVFSPLFKWFFCGLLSVSYLFCSYILLCLLFLARILVTLPVSFL